MSTRVVNLSRRKFTLYIGREWRYLPKSKWHNPFHISEGQPRGSTLDRFEAYLRSRPDLLADLHEIDDEVLGCHCRPEACHGDVLIKVRKEQLDAITTENHCAVSA